MTRKLVITACAATAGAGLGAGAVLAANLAWDALGHGPNCPAKSIAMWASELLLIATYLVARVLGGTSEFNAHVAIGLLGAILVGGPTAVWQLLLKGNNEKNDNKNQTVS